MKNILFAALALVLWSACQSNTSTPAVATAPTVDSTAEKTAVIAAVRGFFSWYDQYLQSPEYGDEKYDFIDSKTAHPTLKPAALDAYLGQFVKSGFAGQAFVQRYKAFYQKANMLWQSEENGDIPSGMDADPFFCAQDDVLELYLKAPVTVQFTGPDKATATLKITDPGMENNLRVFMQKENGKWLYAGTECDLGVE